jgi:murein L,D-transpeptidase YafK
MQSRRPNPLRSPNIRATLLAIVGLGICYKLAINRGLIPRISDLTDRTTEPTVVCPPDERFHTIDPNFQSPNQPIAKLLPQNFDKNKTSILIEKSQYRLTVYYNQKPIKSYPTVFGANPQGDKQREGDRKTPEGILRIQDKYPHPNWSKFIWLDYPNAQSECKHKRAKQQRQIPLVSTIGGEVGIHGVPWGGDWMIPMRRNWTLGCPSLKTKDVDELYTVVAKGTIVEIIS